MSRPQAVVRGNSEDDLLPTRFSQLIEWPGEFFADGSCRAQVEHVSLWFLQRGSELSRRAVQIRKTGDSM